MNSNTRLIVNTLAQNIRTLINIVLSLYSTRIAMEALGHSDYGIYMLVAGIVSLLSYLNNTLIITTQRFLSYAAGAGRKKEMKQIFANSYLIHWLVGLSLALLFASLTSLIFNGHSLNIPVGKAGEAEIVYWFVILSVLITFITAPFRALLISHENIVYISIVDVLDGVLKLGLVCSLLFVEHWRLPLYALIMASVMLFNFIMLSCFCYWKYEECTLLPRIRQWDTAICRKLMNFATWTIYGMACVYVRTQGIAVILNRMFGTIANAAYGIATQVFGSVQFLSQAILNAFSPQIIKAEGCGDRGRSIHLALSASKYSFLLLSLAVIPLVTEMPSLLRIWLGKVPEHAVLFCRMMLIASLCDQATIGLGNLNQAIGRIRNYTLVTFTAKVLCIPVIILFRSHGLMLVVCAYVGFEILSAAIRVPFLMHTAGLRLDDYLGKVFFRIVVPALAMVVGSWLVVHWVPAANWRFLVVTLVTTLTGLIAIWYVAMTPSENALIRNLVLKRLNNEKN
ncbi:MAG: hypothetical protein IJ197_04140 [Bacteroidaceae bacterium]|nr:hypothetical protein [Bacteroidaceae bacterium]